MCREKRKEVHVLNRYPTMDVLFVKLFFDLGNAL
jgi:hypothetical protein